MSPGTYTINIDYFGFYLKIIDNVIINDSMSTVILDISLKKNLHIKKEDIIRVGTIKLIDPSEPNKKVIYRSALRNMGG